MQGTARYTTVHQLWTADWQQSAKPWQKWGVAWSGFDGRAFHLPDESKGPPKMLYTLHLKNY